MTGVAALFVTIRRIGIVAVTILLSATTARGQPPRHPELDAGASKRLRMGWFVYEEAPRGCQHPAKEVAKFLTERLHSQHLEIEAVEIKNYAIEDLLRTGDEKVDLAYFTPFTYVLVERLIPGAKDCLPGESGARPCPLRPLVSYVFHGARERFSTIVWKETQGGTTLEALLKSLHNDRSKKLALVNPRSSSGFLWPSRLLGGGIDIPRGKITTVFAGSHDRALEFLMNYPEIVAAATFDSHLEDYVTRHREFPAHKFAVLTPPLPLDVLAARDSVTTAEGQAIRDAMRTMKKGNDVFDRCFAAKLDAWVDADSSYYDLVRAFMHVTDPAPSLRLAKSCEPMRNRIDNELAGWFATVEPDASARGPHVLDLSCVDGEHDLRAKLAALRKANPIIGYVNEDRPADPDSAVRDVRASFGNRGGLVPGMAATIKRQVWLADDPVAQRSPLVTPARITQIRDDGEVQLRAVAEAGRLSVNQDLDPGDRMIASVEVHGYSSDVGGAEERAELALEVTDANITSKGGMEIEYRVRVLDRATKEDLKATDWGWLLETSRAGEPPTLDLIPPGGPDLRARISLSGSSLSSRVTVRLLGNVSSPARATGSVPGCASSNAACVSIRFGLWSGISVWSFVMLGALIGTALRWAGLWTARTTGTPGTATTPDAAKTPDAPKTPDTATTPDAGKTPDAAKAVALPGEREAGLAPATVFGVAHRSSRLRGCARGRIARRALGFVARHGVELAAGVGTGLLLFLVFVTAKPDVLKALDSNAIITRLGVGVVGGVIGASGLAALIHRMIGLKN